MYFCFVFKYYAKHCNIEMSCRLEVGNNIFLNAKGTVNSSACTGSYITLI